MRLPRDLSVARLASLLGRYGYLAVRQTGDHLRLVSSIKGGEHRITIPLHKDLRVGTLSAILTDVAAYLELDREVLSEELFGR
ncbi:MAG TPA: type II toxin-antitoxin system HicA family toxin [Dehalococcoidia bacterium]|nr:type II toxin-antitoxin system HicA family toxin [Dehalococcoidia bacterium]